MWSLESLLSATLHAFAHGHDGVPRDGVPGFVFEAPPVGEGGDGGVFGRDLVGDLVHLERVVEGANLVAVLVGDGLFGEELVGAVAVDLHVELAAQHVGERFELQIALGGDGVLVSLGDLGVVAVPGGHVVFGVFKGLTHHFKVAHARGRKLIAAAVDALGIFAGSELDRAGRVGKEHGIAIEANFVLDDDGLAADHVGRAVQQQLGGDTAGERLIERLVAIVEGVDHVHRRA